MLLCNYCNFLPEASTGMVQVSTSGRELLAIYIAIKHFRYILEGRMFFFCANHKPLTNAIAFNSDRYTPEGIRRLDCETSERWWGTSLTLVTITVHGGKRSATSWALQVNEKTMTICPLFDSTHDLYTLAFHITFRIARLYQNYLRPSCLIYYELRCSWLYFTSAKQSSPIHPILSLPNAQWQRDFSHVHLDIVGPLPPADGYRFLLTCFDRLACW